MVDGSSGRYCVRSYVDTDSADHVDSAETECERGGNAVQWHVLNGVVQTEQTRQDEGQQQQGEANGKLSAFANGWPEGLAGGSLPEFGERCGRHGCKGDVG